MPEPAGNRWVLLIHQIPPKPDYFRVKVWRHLQRLGAVPIKNSVYVLPRTADAMEDFQWQLREIVAGGGEASICEAAFVDGLSDAEIEKLFREAREQDYAEVATEAKRLGKVIRTPRDKGDRGPRAETEVARLRRRLTDLVAIDFFGAPGRQAAEAALEKVESRLRLPERRDTTRATARRATSTAVRGRTWVTRRSVFVDRIASAWLIRRFIDPEARFKFVAPEGYEPQAGELRFDMYEAEYTHEGDLCTFETLIARFRLADPALRPIAEMVHDIDCKDQKFERSETPGVARLLAGIAGETADDVQRLERGAALFDALHASLARKGAARLGRARGRLRRSKKRL